MKNPCQTMLRTVLSVALTLAPLASQAEDIDLFVGSTTSTAANRPNVLIIIDNSANWSAADQGWPNNEKQGQSELRSLSKVVGELNDGLNLGLMLFTPGSGSNKDGGYVRFGINQMTVTNKAALQELIGTSTCVNGPNSFNGTPNCIAKNFDDPTEKVGTAKTDYSATLFEAFKYFGGYTSPANAKNDVAGSPISASQFGPTRYAGDPDAKTTKLAFTNPFVDYKTPIDSTNSCAKNYIIFIGNGFPVSDSPASLLSGVGGDPTQLPMQQWSSTTIKSTIAAGSACGTATGNPTNTLPARRAADCTVNLNQASLLAANPTADAGSFTCLASSISGASTALCTNPNSREFTVQGTASVITVTPTGAAAVPTISDARFADEWTKFLYTTDVSSALGQQNVATYTIDVFKNKPDAKQTSLLQNMAKVGGGRYFQATDENAILNALREILVEIQAVNSVFASASLPINATNRSQNENQVFIGMFRPNGDGRPNWYGNLKRYQIALINNEAKLADKDGKDAVAAATGFVQSCASSFWTTDSDKYWGFASDGAGLCLTSSTSPFSDLPDGPMVEKGAAAEVIRRGNKPTASPLTYAENRTIYTCASPTSCGSLVNFDNTNVSQAALLAGSATEQDKIINFIRGQDVRDENADGILTTTRPSLHGDVAHSRPLPVNYGGTNGVVVYYGANDGSLRALSGDTGQELWAFIAPEHHGKLKRLYDNLPLIKYPGTPAGLTPTPQTKDYFFDGSSGVLQNADNSKVWIYPTMRRGGRMLYAFNVSNPTAPVLKWRQGCPNQSDDGDCTSGFSGIGQTWSFPNVASISGYDSGKSPVIIIGGGYDKCEDEDISKNACDLSKVKGNRVYIIDADNGKLIKEFATDRSVVGDVTLIDRNFDGYVDHAYAADVGGNMYRIDFVDPASQNPLADSAWKITKIAQTNVKGEGRKFMFGPAALPSAGPDRTILTIGTGDRERPLDVNYPYVEKIQNRFYMLIDTYATTGLPVDLDAGNLTDLTSNSSCTAALATGAQGWRIDLDNGRGEQTVTSSLIFGGLVFFSTNRPIPATPGVCTGNLGEARGYALNLLNASGAVGTESLCGGVRTGIFTGGGLPPSPVTGVVPIGGRPVSIMIGGINRSGGASSAIGSQKVKPVISQTRSRVYWYNHGDK